MANEENLIPVTELTESEARELSRRGGIASGVARRKKKTMRDAINLALGLRSELTDAALRRWFRFKPPRTPRGQQIHGVWTQI